MKVIDAYWEKRNLGVDVKEIEFETSDSLDDFSEFDKIEQAPYMVVKIPSGRNDLMEEVQKRGFQYIENSIKIRHKLKDININPVIKNVIDKSTVSVMNDNDLEVLFEEINKNIFSTDRIYLDSNFTHEQASLRYINWIKDLVSKGVAPCKIEYMGKTCAFFIQSQEDDKKIGHGILGACYSDFIGGGFGFLMEIQTLLFAKEKGLKLFKTAVSSNNLPVLQIMTSIGYEVYAIDGVFVKHYKEKSIDRRGGGVQLYSKFIKPIHYQYDMKVAA